MRIVADLDHDDLRVIFKALGDLPYREASGPIRKLENAIRAAQVPPDGGQPSTAPGSPPGPAPGAPVAQGTVVAMPSDARSSRITRA